MVQLGTTGDFILVIVIAAMSGLIGGLAAELLLNRDGETGTFAVPKRRNGLWDLGGFGRLIVGAAVGVAILAVVEPQTTVTVSPDGTTTSRTYDIVRLVATAIVAGSAGGSILTALQATTLAMINDSRVQATVAASEQQLEHLAAIAKTEAAALGPQLVAPGARPRGIGAGPQRDAPTGARDAAVEQFSSALDRQLEEAKEVVVAASTARAR